MICKTREQNAKIKKIDTSVNITIESIRIILRFPIFY